MCDLSKVLGIESAGFTVVEMKREKPNSNISQRVKNVLREIVWGQEQDQAPSSS